MSDQATIFELPYNLFLMQRMEFVVIVGDHLAANVMRVMESEMIKRKEAWQVRVEKALEAKKMPPPEPKAWWVRLSQAQIISRLYMYDSAKLKKPESEDLNNPEWVEYRFKRALSISKATLKKAIELLIALGFLIERSKPGDEFGAPIYTLNKDSVQKAIKALPANPFTIFHHLGGLENIETGGESKNFNVPPENLQSGESKKSDIPLEENETGESKNFQVDIDITIDPLEDLEIDTVEESTYGNIASSLPTPAPSQDEPYRPDFSASQEQQGDGNGSGGHSNNVSGDHSNSDYRGGMDDQQPAVGNPQRIAPAQQQAGRLQVSDGHSQLTAHGITRQEAQAVASQLLPAQASGYEKPAELSTLLGSSPQASAKVEPRQPSSKVVANGKRGIPATAQLKPQLTLLGGQVHTDYETIRACKLRLTKNNVNALNTLGEMDGMDFVNLKEVIEVIESQELVKSKDIPIGPQELASEEGYWRFDKWLPVVVRNRQRQASSSAQPKPASSLPSFSGMSDKEYYASLRKGTANARTIHAR